jgi:hypothetical protein
MALKKRSNQSSSLTFFQFKAYQYAKNAEFAKNADLKTSQCNHALNYLQELERNNEAVPKWLWGYVARKAILLGAFNILKECIPKIGFKVRKKEILLCAQNALNAGHFSTAIDAYAHIEQELPQKEFLAAMKKYMKKNPDCIVYVCTMLNMPVPKQVLITAKQYAINKYAVRTYGEMCSHLGEKPDRKFIKECLDKYMYELKPSGVRFAAKLLGRKIGKSTLTKLATRAFKAHKPSDAEEFLQMINN